MMIPAALLFERVANRAASLASQRPAYVSYRATTRLSLPSLEREQETAYRITLRTRDDRARLEVLPHGATTLAEHPFPFSPCFDALSTFRMQYSLGMGGQMHFLIDHVTPLTYLDPVAHDADVVVTSLRSYRVTDAPDSSDAPTGERHLLLQPYSSTLAAAPRDSFFFHEVRISNRTDLPTLVDFRGAHDLHFTIEYGIVAGMWMVHSAHLEQTMHGPFGIGAVHFLADTVFDDLTPLTDVPAQSNILD